MTEKMLLAIAVFLAGFAAAWALQELRLSAELEHADATLQRERAQAAVAAAGAIAGARAEERRRAAAIQEAADAAQDAARLARADADRLRVERDGVRADLAAFVAASRAAGNPATAGSSPPAADALDLLAKLLSGEGDAADEYARIADERGAAGQLCERSYDALTP